MSKNNKQSKKTIAAGYLLDYISGKQIKETKKEGVISFLPTFFNLVQR